MGNIISVDLILEDSSHAKSIFLAFLYGLYIVFFIRTAVGIAYIVGVLTGADLSVAACSVIFLEDEAAIVDLALQTRAERGVSAEIRSALSGFLYASAGDHKPCNVTEELLVGRLIGNAVRNIDYKSTLSDCENRDGLTAGRRSLGIPHKRVVNSDIVAVGHYRKGADSLGVVASVDNYSKVYAVTGAAIYIFNIAYRAVVVDIVDVLRACALIGIIGVEVDVFYR